MQSTKTFDDIGFNLNGASVKRVGDTVLVEAGTFCGKLATAHVHVNPANLTKMLGGAL